MELKNTLLMNKSKFEMRGNLNLKEPILVESWLKNSLYNEMNKNKLLGDYVLHDGPPYANGAMHCGHMLNRVLKDFVVRFKNMQGYHTPFVFGWDTHGLPIENQVIKSGVNRKTTPIIEFRNKCAEYALKQVELQKKSIQRLGVLGDYDNPYITLNKEYEASEIRCFANMALKGLIYKGLKPVYWSPSSESALAEAEIEYQDVEAYTVYVSFKVKDGKNIIDNDVKFIIWTTTPWTLPANLAVCLHPNFEYGIYKTEKGKFLFLCELKDKIVENIGFSQCDLIKTLKGSELEYVTCYHPFYDRESFVINADYVTSEDGTGIVHIAPGHGEDDYLACLKYNIKPFCPVDEHGKMMKECGPLLEGLFYEDANLKVIDILKENNNLLKLNKIVHSYPHDWRTHKPVIFRATPQWFCSIEPIREKLINEIKNIKWTPAWGEQRMINMIKDRHDWCISRQRIWGVPLPIIYCEDGTPIIEKEVFDHIEKIIYEEGSNAWFIKDAKELLPNNYKNSHSPNDIYKKETDIMDVWFDSGSSFNYVLNDRNLGFPSDLYLEGSDQYRGWFNSSLIISLACFDKAPYKHVVSHGYVLDENWEKMSKSKGNGIDPLKVANQYGADILRLWVATIDYQQDVKISENLIKQNTDTYRKIRNTFKFMLSNLIDGDSIYFENKDKIPYESLPLTEKYILNRLYSVSNSFINNFSNYQFLNAMNDLMKFISDDLSSFYLDISKDSLYCDKKDSLRRREIQTVLNECVNILMRLLNVILPFTMDEVNQNYHLKEFDNVQLYPYPKLNENIDLELINKYQKYLINLRTDVLKQLEIKRNEDVIHSAQEALVNLNINNEEYYSYIFNNFNLDQLKELFIVSKVILNKNSGSKDNVDIQIKHHEGCKCSRCWNYFDNNKLCEIEGNNICPRCLKILK